jgi:hypothetical protein
MRITLVLSAMLMAATLAGISGCSKRDEAMGPAQKAGKAVDAAVDNTGDKVAAELHDKIDRANRVAQDLAKSAQATSDKIDEATGDASNGLHKATEEVGKKVERAGEKIQEAAH